MKPMNRSTKAIFILLAVIVAFVFLAAGAFRLLPPDIRGERLLDAARWGSVSRAKLFLFLGSDINYATGGGTALHYAAMFGNTALIELLLNHGADPNSVAKWDITPLYNARTYNHPEAERILLAHGANPDTSHINPP
jgi:ankyrin repeat protein